MKNGVFSKKRTIPTKKRVNLTKKRKLDDQASFWYIFEVEIKAKAKTNKHKEINIQQG